MKRTLVLSIGFFLLVGALSPVFFLENADAGTGSWTPECSLNGKAGRTIVQFSAGAVIADGDEDDASTGVVYRNIPEGRYKITLESYDNHFNKRNQDEKLEQWHLIAGNEEGEDVVVTEPTPDLPESVEYSTDVVENSVDVWNDVTWLLGFHSYYPNSQENSVTPVCAAFDRLDGTPSNLTADIEANQSDGPITIDYNTRASIRWSSDNADSCSVSPSGWTGRWGSEDTGKLTQSRTYTLTCKRGSETATDSVVVNVKNQSTTVPIALTNLATGITANSVRLNGTAIPGASIHTSGWFEWGTSSSLGNRTNTRSLGNQSSMSFSEDLAGLSSNTTYYFRAAVNNDNGLVYGNTLSFKTSIIPSTGGIGTSVTRSLSITKEIAGSCASGCKNVTVDGGATVEYIIRVKNTGTTGLSNLVIEDPLSSYVEFKSATEGGKLEAGKVVWRIPLLGEGGTKTLKYTALAKKSSDKTVATGKAKGRADNVSSRESNSVSVAITPTSGTTTGSPLSLTLAEKFLERGKVAEYTIRFENTTTAKITDLDVEVILPNSLTFEGNDADYSEADNIILYSLGDLDPGKSVTKTFRVQVEDGVKTGDSVVVRANATYLDGEGMLKEVAMRLTSTVDGNGEDESASAFLGISFLKGTWGKVVGWLVIIIGVLLLILFILYVYDRITARRIRKETLDIR